MELAWFQAAPHLLRAIKRTKKSDMKSCLHSCLEGTSQLWTQIEIDGCIGAIITDIESYHNGRKVLRIVALGGDDLKSWGRLGLDRIEAFAKEEDCNSVEMVGRKGWGRWFPDYEPIEYVYSKEI